MELRVNEPGLFIEELVFQIRPELVKRYVELEYEIMAKERAGWLLRVADLGERNQSRPCDVSLFLEGPCILPES